MLEIKKIKNKNVLRLGIFFILSIGLRIFQQFVFYAIGYDKTRQIIAGGNYLRGNGVSDCTVSVNNLSEVICQPQTWWAVGYPILISWLNFFTQDFITSDFLLICIGYVVLFVSTYFMFEAIDYRSKIVSPFELFLLFSAFSFTPYHYLPSTDLLSYAFFVAGCAASLSILKGKYWLPGILSGLLFFISVLIKYNFYPFLIIVPAALFLLFIISHKKHYLFSLISYSLTVLTGFGLLWFISPAHISNREMIAFSAKWNWNYLLQFDPFPIKGFFFIDSILTKVQSIPSLEKFVIIGIWIASLLLVISFVSYIFLLLKKSILNKTINAEIYIYLLGIITLAINVGFLVWLSLRLPVFPQPNNPIWTFVWETRYYVPTIFFLQVFLFTIPFKPDLKFNKCKKVFGFLTVLSVAFAFSYSTWKYYDVFVNNRLDGTYYAENIHNVELGNFLKNNLRKEIKPVILTFLNYGESYGASRITTVDSNGKHIIRSYYTFDISEKIETTSPVILYFILPDKLSENESEFVESHNASVIFELSATKLYRMEVNP